MKLIELNIGLTSAKLGTITACEALNALQNRGFVLITYRTQESVCKDGKETCLAVKCEAPSDWQERLADLAKHLGQDCIAVCGFIGPAPYDTFAPSLWVSSETPQTVTVKGYND